MRQTQCVSWLQCHACLQEGTDAGSHGRRVPSAERTGCVQSSRQAMGCRVDVAKRCYDGGRGGRKSRFLSLSLSLLRPFPFVSLPGCPSYSPFDQRRLEIQPGVRLSTSNGPVVAFHRPFDTTSSYTMDHDADEYPRGRDRSRSQSMSRTPEPRGERDPEPEPAYGSRTPEKRSRSDSASQRKRSPPRPSHAPDNPEPTLIVGVFGLSVRTVERDLEEEFGRVAPVEKVVIVYDARVSVTERIDRVTRLSCILTSAQTI